jgi:hypothetical protein
VEGGHSISIEVENKREVARFLGMAPLAALLYQQNRLALHAAALADERGAILLGGDSGSGKSTLLAAMLQRGWTMLSDDLTALECEAGIWKVAPTAPEIRLRRDAANNLGRSTRWPVRKQGHCHLISAVSDFAANPQPLHRIYWLNTHNFEGFEFTLLDGTDRFRALGALAYNSHIAAALLDYGKYLREAGSVARSVPVYSLRRPRGRWTVEELADKVEAA